MSRGNQFFLGGRQQMSYTHTKRITRLYRTITIQTSLTLKVKQINIVIRKKIDSKILMTPQLRNITGML